MSGFTVRVTGFHADRHNIDLTVTHTAFGNHGFTKTPHPGRRSAQKRGFQAIVMVQMHVGGDHHHIMVFMLELDQAFGQIASVVVEHIGKTGHTKFGLVLLQIDFRQLLAQQITHGFRPVLVAALLHQLVKLLRQTFLQRDSEALHAFFSRTNNFWDHTLTALMNVKK